METTTCRSAGLDPTEMPSTWPSSCSWWPRVIVSTAREEVTPVTLVTRRGRCYTPRGGSGRAPDE
ncbi:hypothetical protein [Ornithinimicrobium kibberense]|uniref:hypothetical protein n=1 Tax=Ornithinimicrobium kibberense TaxID=282060 RepID=UPI00361AC067